MVPASHQRHLRSSFPRLDQTYLKVMETQVEDPTTLENASTQELCEELFSRSDWREAVIPNASVERGAALKMNAKDEVGEDNRVWPVIEMGQMELGAVMQNAAEGYWRTHVNSFRQEDNEELAHKHRNESTDGFKDVKVSGEHRELPIVRISARNAGTIKSKEQEKLEAKKKLQDLIESGDLTKEEAMEMLS